MKTHLPLFVVAVLLLQGATAARGADLDRVLAVLDEIKDRHDGYNPMDVRYTLRTTRTKYGYAAVNNIEPADKRLWERLRESTGTYRGQFAQKGNLWLRTSEGPRFSNEGIQVEAKRRGVTAYDGTLLRTTGGDGKVVTISRKKPTRVTAPFGRFNGEETLLRLRDFLKGGTKPTAVTVTGSDPRVPGSALHIRLEFGDNGSSYDIWVSPPDKGSCVLRLESRVRGNLFHEYTDCEYKSVDGVRYLHKAVVRNYYHDKDIHELATEDRFEVDRITFRADEIPDALFQIPVKGDTELIDRDRKDMRIIGPEKVEEHIRKAVEDVKRERAGLGWLPWAYGAGSVLFLAGTAFMGVRIVRSRRRRAVAVGG